MSTSSLLSQKCDCFSLAFHIFPFYFPDLQEYMQYGSIPMQTTHMKQNYAAYLSNNFPMVIIFKFLEWFGFSSHNMLSTPAS